MRAATPRQEILPEIEGIIGTAAATMAGLHSVNEPMEIEYRLYVLKGGFVGADTSAR